MRERHIFFLKFPLFYFENEVQNAIGEIQKNYICRYLILNYTTVFPIPCSQDKKRRNFKRKICCSEKTTILVTIHSLAQSYEVMIYDIVYSNIKKETNYNIIVYLIHTTYTYLLTSCYAYKIYYP